MAIDDDGSSEIEPVGDGAPPWDVFKLLDKSGVPFTVIRNAVVAIGKGLTGIVVAGEDVPRAWLQGASAGIRDRTAGRGAVAKAAAASAAKALSADDALTQRAIEYFGANIIGEQENREAVAKDAVHQLINSTVTTDSDREIDVDWLTAFWKLAETKSKPEVQTLLSRILVGEITRPGSVSPQTLQILSVLTTDVALRFERLCNLSIEDEDSTYVIHPHVFPFQHIGPLDAYGISLADLQMLDGMRLIQAAETTVLNIADAAPPEFDDVNYAGVSARLSLSGKQMHLIFLTQAGRELRRLLELKQLDSYTQELKTKFGDQFQV